MRSSADSLEYAGDRAYKLSWCTGSRDVWQELEKQDLLLMASSALKATYDESQEGGRSDGVEKKKRVLTNNIMAMSVLLVFGHL